MALEGTLEEVSLADILQLLALGQKTGCLSVTDRSNFGYVYFENGKITYASVLNRPDRLGELLVRNGAITREQLSIAMKNQAQQPGARLGEILVEMGALSQEELDRWITTQIEEAVYHLFSWTKGSFHFDPDQTPDEEGTLLVNLNADALLMEGARRVDEWSLIEKKIPSLDLIYQLQRDPREEEDVELTEDQLKIIPLLEGERTVREVVEDSGLVEFDAAKALFGLLQAGFAAQVGKRVSPKEDEDERGIDHHLRLGSAFYRSGMMEDAAREFQRVLRTEGTHPEARLMLGLIHLKARQFESALEHFDAVSEEDGQGYVHRMNRALALEQMGRYPEAVETLVDAEAVRPGDTRALLARGIVRLKSGDAPDAHATFQRYRRKMGDETPPSIFYSYAVLAAALDGELEEAASLGREGLGVYPESGPILVNTGLVLERRGERDAGAEYYLRAVSGAGPTPPQAHKNLGDQAFQRGDRAGARAHYERAVKLAPRLGDDVYLRLGRIAYEEEDHDLALLLWQRALEINPENQAVRTNLEALKAAPDR